MDIKENLEHQRWLIDNGIITDMHKDNLYIYGAICHPGIQAVELEIKVEDKKLKYILYIDKKLEKILNEFYRLRESKTIWGLWRLKRILKKNGNLNISNLISKMISTYLGPKWVSEVEIKSINEYTAAEAEQKQ